MHLTLILLAVLHLQPLNRRLSQVAWVYFLQTSVAAHGYKVHSLTKASAHPAAARVHDTPSVADCRALALLCRGTGFVLH